MKENKMHFFFFFLECLAFFTVTQHIYLSELGFHWVKAKARVRVLIVTNKTKKKKIRIQQTGKLLSFSLKEEGINNVSLKMTFMLKKKTKIEL